MMLRQWVLLLSLLLPASMLHAQVESFVEGTAYFTLKEAQPTEVEADQVEVLEVFSYVCSHCGHLDPVLVEWSKTKPAQAKLRYLPAVWQKPGWVEYAAAYFAAEQLGIIDRSHHALMTRLWVENNPPKSMEDIGEFHAQFGVSAEDFIKTLQSPEVNAKLQAAASQAGKYEVEGTPTLIIDGRWRFDVVSAGGPDKVGPLIDFLVAKALNLRGKQG